MSLELHDQPPIERGDPARLAFRVEFVPNLDPGFRTREEDRSWGRLTLWADGQNLCEHFDQREVRRQCEWYLLPILEWFTDNWDYLFHEQRPPVANEAESAWESFSKTNQPDRFERPDGEWDEQRAQENYDWGTRHALRHCRTGGLFPDVVIRRWRNECEISWGATKLPGTPEGFRFLTPPGFFRVPVEEAVEVFHAVLSRAAVALLNDNPESRRLQELQHKVEALTSPERNRRRVTNVAVK